MEFMSVYKDRNSGNWVKQGLSSHQALAGIHETKHVSKTEGRNPFDKLVSPENIYVTIHNSSRIIVMK